MVTIKINPKEFVHKRPGGWFDRWAVPGHQGPSYPRD